MNEYTASPAYETGQTVRILRDCYSVPHLAATSGVYSHPSDIRPDAHFVTIRRESAFPPGYRELTLCFFDGEIAPEASS